MTTPDLQWFQLKASSAPYQEQATVKNSNIIQFLKFSSHFHSTQTESHVTNKNISKKLQKLTTHPEPCKAAPSALTF